MTAAVAATFDAFGHCECARILKTLMRAIAIVKPSNRKFEQLTLQ